jgi:NADH-quinone oxidoreductase subunit L
VAPGTEHAAQIVHETGHAVGLELLLMAVSVAIAVAGIVAAWRVYAADPRRAEALGARFRGMYRILWNKYYVDEIYEASVARPVVEFSRGLWRVFDDQVIDGMVNGAGRTMRGIGSLLRPIQNGITGNYAAAIMVGAIVIVGYVLLGGGR